MTLRALPWQPPDQFLAAYGDEPWAILLDSGGPIGPRSRWSFFCCRPSHIYQGDIHSGWARMTALMPPISPESPLPFSGGLIGLASYEAGLRLEHIASRHQPVMPDLSFARYEGALVFDRQKKKTLVEQL